MAQIENLALLRLFVQVADLGSFSAVARVIRTTPSAVSRQIARLEADLGVRLLQRTTRQQVLTEAGETYLHHARQIIEDLDAARRAVTQLGNVPSGVLRVTAEADLAHTLLSPLLPEFLDRYPNLRVQLHTSAQMEDLIGRGIDVAIRMGHLADSNLVAKRLTVSRSVLVASPAFLEKHETPRHPAELERLSCLSFWVESEVNVWRFRDRNAVIEVPVTGRVQAQSLGVLREAAKSGCGIAMLPVWMVRQDLDDGGLVALLPEFPLEPPATPISAVYPSGRNLASKVRVFVDYLSAQIERNFG